MNKQDRKTLSTVAPKTLAKIEAGDYISKLPPPNPQLTKKAQQDQIDAFNEDVVGLFQDFQDDIGQELELSGATFAHALHFAEKHSPKNNYHAFLLTIIDLLPLLKCKPE